MDENSDLCHSLRQIKHSLGGSRKEALEALTTLREVLQEHEVQAHGQSSRSKIHHAIGLETCHALAEALVSLCIKLSSATKPGTVNRLDPIQRLHSTVRYLLTTLHRRVDFDDICPPLSWKRGRIVPIIVDFLTKEMADEARWQLVCVECAMSLQKLLSTRVYLASLSADSTRSIKTLICKKLGISSAGTAKTLEKVPSSCTQALTQSLHILIENCIFDHDALARILEGCLHIVIRMQTDGFQSSAALSAITDMLQLIPSLAHRVSLHKLPLELIALFIKQSSEIWQEVSKDAWKLAIFKIFATLSKKMNRGDSRHTLGANGPIQTILASMQSVLENVSTGMSKNILHSTSWKELQLHHYAQLCDLTSLFVDTLHASVQEHKLSNCDNDLALYSPENIGHPYHVWIILEWFRKFPNDFFVIGGSDTRPFECLLAEWIEGDSYQEECFCAIHAIVVSNADAQCRKGKLRFITDHLMPSTKTLQGSDPGKYWALLSAFMLDYGCLDMRRQFSEESVEGANNSGDLLAAYERYFEGFDVMAVGNVLGTNTIRDSVKSDLIKAIIPFGFACCIDLSTAYLSQVPSWITESSRQEWLDALSILAFHCITKRGMGDHTSLTLSIAHIAEKLDVADVQTEDDALNSFYFFSALHTCLLKDPKASMRDIHEFILCILQLLEACCDSCQQKNTEKDEFLYNTLRSFTLSTKQVLSLGNASANSLISKKCIDVKNRLLSLAESRFDSLHSALTTAVDEEDQGTSLLFLCESIETLLDIIPQEAIHENLHIYGVCFHIAGLMMAESFDRGGKQGIQTMMRIFALLLRVGAHHTDICESAHNKLFLMLENQTASCASSIAQLIQNAPSRAYAHLEPLFHGFALLLHSAMGSKDRIFTPDRLHLHNLCEFTVFVLERTCPEDLFERYSTFIKWAVFHGDDDLRSFAVSLLTRIGKLDDLMQDVVECTTGGLRRATRKRKEEIVSVPPLSTEQVRQCVTTLDGIFQGATDRIRILCLTEVVKLISQHKDDTEVLEPLVAFIKQHIVFSLDFADMILHRLIEENTRHVKIFGSALREAYVDTHTIFGKSLSVYFIAKTKSKNDLHEFFSSFAIKGTKEDQSLQSLTISHFAVIVAHFHVNLQSKGLNEAARKALLAVEALVGEKEFHILMREQTVSIALEMIPLFLLRDIDGPIDENNTNHSFLNALSELSSSSGSQNLLQLLYIHSTADIPSCALNLKQKYPERSFFIFEAANAMLVSLRAKMNSCVTALEMSIGAHVQMLLLSDSINEVDIACKGFLQYSQLSFDRKSINILLDTQRNLRDYLSEHNIKVSTMKPQPRTQQEELSKVKHKLDAVDLIIEYVNPEEVKVTQENIIGKLSDSMKDHRPSELDEPLRFLASIEDVSFLKRGETALLSKMLWAISIDYQANKGVQFLALTSLSRLWTREHELVESMVGQCRGDILAAEPFVLSQEHANLTSPKDPSFPSIDHCLVNCVVYRILHGSTSSTGPLFQSEACRFFTHALCNARDHYRRAISNDLRDALRAYDSDESLYISANARKIEIEFLEGSLERWVANFAQALVANVLSKGDVLAHSSAVCALSPSISKLVFLYCLVKAARTSCEYVATISEELQKLLSDKTADLDIARFIIHSISFVYFNVSSPQFVQELTKAKNSRSKSHIFFFGIPLDLLYEASARAKMPHEALFFRELQHGKGAFPSLNEHEMSHLREDLTAIFSQLKPFGKFYVSNLSLGHRFEGRIAALRNRGNPFWEAVLLEAHGINQPGDRDDLGLAQCYQKMKLHGENNFQVLSARYDTHKYSEAYDELQELKSYAAWSQAQWKFDGSDDSDVRPSCSVLHQSIHASLCALKNDASDAFSFSLHSAKRAALKKFERARNHERAFAHMVLINSIDDAWAERKIHTADQEETSTKISRLQMCTVSYPMREIIDDIHISIAAIQKRPGYAKMTAECALHAAKMKQNTLSLALIERAEGLAVQFSSTYIKTIARAFWKIGESDFAMDMLTGRAEDPEGAFLLAKWKCKANRESVMRVLKDRLLPLAEELDAASSYYTCAVYQDQIYSTLQASVQSTDHRETVEGIQTSTEIRAECYADYNRVKNALPDDRKRHIQRYMYQQDRELKRALMEIDQISKDRDKYCAEVLTSYANVLIKGGLKRSKMLTAAYRFVSIWLENAESSATSVVAENLPRIPTRNFVELFPQMCARLSMPASHSVKQEPEFDTFQKVLRILLKSIIAEHPHATLPTMFALANGSQFPKGEEDVHTVDKTKVAAASTLLREMMKEAAKCNQALMQTIAETNLLIEAYIELAFTPMSGSKNTITQKLAKIKDFNRVAIISGSDPNERIYRFSEGVSLPGGVNLPKLIQCIGESGRVYKQLVKSNDDMRQDALVQQVFRLCNAIFADKDTALKSSIRTYRVIPLTQTSGIVEWVDDTMPLSEYLTGPSNAEYKGAHARYRPGNITHAKARSMMQGVAKDSMHKKRSVFEAVCESFTPCFRFFFIETTSSAVEAYERRIQYTLSVAASSIVGYIVGLGDRHNSNILIDRSTGQIIHIDIGLAFDEGMLLPVPELVPFRLTRDVVDAMGITGTDGLFRAACEGVLLALRGSRKMLNTVIETLLHDPLAKWAVNYKRILQQTREPGAGEKISVDAERALLKVNQKLQGFVNGENLSVQAQTQLLISQATSNALLCQMFHGWSAWV